jgi:hypothetical protein
MLSSSDVRITPENFNQVFDFSPIIVCNSQFCEKYGYHVTPFILDCQILSAQHTFLLRDPSLSIPSLYKMWENYHENETVLTDQRTLFKRIYTLAWNKPFILDVEHPITSPIKSVGCYFDFIKPKIPRGILDWHPISRYDWKASESWHVDVINSRGFVDTKRNVKTEPSPSRMEQIIQKNTVYYNYIWEQVS